MSARCAFSRASCAPRWAYCRLRLWLCDEAVEVDAVAGWVERRVGWDIVEMEGEEEGVCRGGNERKVGYIQPVGSRDYVRNG